MSTAIIAQEEMPRINADDAGLILTSGPDRRANHVFADWFKQMRFAGWEEFQRLPMPERTDEAWRFATVKALDLSAFRTPFPVSDEARAQLVGRSRGLEKVSGRMVFANDQLLSREVFADELERKGVIWAPIEKAITEHEDVFRKYFMTQDVVLGGRKFAALHQALVKSGTFLHVPRGVELELPIEVFHWLDGEGGSTFPHTLLVAEDMSRVTLVDYFQSSERSAPGLACGVNDLILGQGAKLTYVCVQDWGDSVKALQINSTVVGRDSHATSLNLNLGSAYARTESVSRLTGTGARSDMLAVSVATGEQEFDQRTLQDHQAPNTASDLLYKNSLSEKSRTIFAGLIRVEPHAHQTDAYQKVRNLLLSDDAEANSMPGLEILADQVKCSHGATSGQIDEEELFYMLARGLHRETAQQLIVNGFLQESIDRVGNEAIAADLRERVGQKFIRASGHRPG